MAANCGVRPTERADRGERQDLKASVGAKTDFHNKLKFTVNHTTFFQRQTALPGASQCKTAESVAWDGLSGLVSQRAGHLSGRVEAAGSIPSVCSLHILTMWEIFTCVRSNSSEGQIKTKIAC